MNSKAKQVYQYLAEVPKLGFEIIREDVPYNPETDLLTIRGGGLSNGKYKSDTYEVFTDTLALYRIFADTPLTNEGVIAFANKYGYLGGSFPKFESTVKQPKFQTEHLITIEKPRFWSEEEEWDIYRYLLRGDFQIHCEVVYLWFVEIQLFNLAIKLWEGAKQEDEKLLSSFMTFEEGVLTFELPFDPHPRTRENLHRGVPGAPVDFIMERYGPFSFLRIEDGRESFTYSSEGTLVYPYKIRFDEWNGTHTRPLAFFALELLRNIINYNLSLIYPRMVMTDNGQLELVLQPRSLAMALWFQFAQAIELRKNYNVCQSCGKWLEISKYGSRRDKKYCSNKCRQAAYDARQRATN